MLAPIGQVIKYHPFLPWMIGHDDMRQSSAITVLGLEIPDSFDEDLIQMIDIHLVLLEAIPTMLDECYVYAMIHGFMNQDECQEDEIEQEGAQQDG